MNPGGSIPNLFLIGAPKCGTTAMASYLAAHREAFVCEPKEPYYWSDDLPRLRDLSLIRCERDYCRLFAGKRARTARVRCDASTVYLYSQRAVPRICTALPEAKFVVMLRNPIELASAFHMEMLYVCQEDVADFSTAWRLQAERGDGRRLPSRCLAPQLLQYRDVASLGIQFRRLLEVVPRSQVHAIVFDDFRADPGREYRSLLSFLGLSDDGRTDFPRLNEATSPRFHWFLKSTLTPPAALRPAMLAARRVGRWRVLQPLRQLKNRLIRRRRPRRELDERTRAELASELQADVRLLSDLLGRDFTPWLGGSALGEGPCT